MPSVKRRTYNSPRRRENAEETRRRVLASARRLFLESGFGDATIESVAQAAGVSTPTVYAGFGSKRGLLFALLDEFAVDADLERLEDATKSASGDPTRQLRERIAFSIRLYAGAIDLINIVRTASGVEPDLQAMWDEGEARRYRSQMEMVEGWAQAGKLASGLTVQRATDVMWALTGPDAYRLFVRERNWSTEEFRQWLEEMLERQLLRP